MQNRMTSLSAPPNFTLCELRIQLSLLTVKRRVVLIISPLPFSRLALICTVLSGFFFSQSLLVLVEDCDTWRLMACISDMLAGEQEASSRPSFMPAKLC